MKLTRPLTTWLVCCVDQLPQLMTDTPKAGQYLRQKELQALVRRLDALQEMVTAEQNRLETATAKVAELTQSHLEYLKQQQDLIKQLITDHFDRHPELKQQRDLLVSIPGIGPQTAAVLLAEIGRIEDYQNARQLAAHAGLTPSERSSECSW